MARGGQRDGTVVVIGGGCSGLFVTAHLLEASREPIDIVLVEPSERLGGLAYRTTDPDHLLNSPAREMSAFSDRPDDFVTFLRESGGRAGGSTFAPRMRYRDYLASVPHRARALANPLSDVEWVRESATALTVRETDTGPRLVVGLAHGGHIAASEVVLALGVPRGGLSLESAHLGASYVADPWVEGALSGVAGEVLLVGTGLTMVDVTLSLARLGATTTVHARSRHGLVPIAHDVRALAHTIPRPARLDTSRLATTRGLLRAIREAAEKADLEDGSWQEVITELRPNLARIWGRLETAEKERALRHLRRYWEIHRHRMAPAGAAQFEELRERRFVETGAGSLESVATEARSGRLEVRLAHGERTETLRVDAIVNCTGPGRDYARGSVLVQQLIGSGLARRGAFGLGLDTDECGDIIDSHGTLRSNLHTVGWARLARLLETTAVPELRAQSESLARRLVARR